MAKRILSEIWIYPVKSLGGIRVSSATVMEKGLRHDRRWMLVDASGRFLTQRNLPQMALFKVSPQGNNFIITHGSDSLQLPTEGGGTTITAQIWSDAVDVVEPSADVSRWFSERLDMACRLVAFPEANPRLIDPAYRLARESVSLADGYPVLIIGQASLDDLNGRLLQPVPMNRFRPNLVFLGGAPYEEDEWKNFRIGVNRFAGVKPCGRCVLTTVDQDNAQVGREPLLTLSKYRRDGDKINFGQNVIPRDYYEIHEGDEIILE